MSTAGRGSGWIGRSVLRREDDRLLRGQGRFVADVKLPGELHLVFVRSVFAHADVTALDATDAQAVEGVVAVLTHRDFPPNPLPPFLWDSPPEKLVRALTPHLRPCHPPLLASNRVRFAGQALAVVAAPDRYIAEDAAELVQVEYDPLPAVAGLDAALAPDAPIIHDGWTDNVAVRFSVAKGDVEQALATADYVLRERFSIQRQAGIPIETRGAVATFDDATGRLTVWSSTQNAYPLRRAIARMSGLEPERVRVIAPDVGGGFGIKGVLYPEDVLVALTALRLRRPVKWIEDRFEHMHSAVHAREQVHEIEIGFDREARIVGLRDQILVDTGAYNPLGLVIPYNTIAHVMGPYAVPAFEAVAAGVITTKTPTAPYRGAGRPEAVFALERLLDRAAKELGIDRIELRLRNLVRPEQMPYEAGILYRDGEPLVLDGGDYPAALRRAVELLEAERPNVEQGRRVGVGVATYIEGTGIGPFEGAAVAVSADGGILIATGACSQGQGHETVFAQVCAEVLGVDPGAVEVIVGDTDGLDRGWGTVASRSAVVAGNAVAEATALVREKALMRAAEWLEIDAADLTIVDGQVMPAGVPARAIPIGELAAAAVAAGDPLAETRYHEPPTVTWSSGAHAALVAVDAELGTVELVRYVAVHDCGRQINPKIVDGQVLGGVAQGVGAALLEEVVYDDDAQLLTATLSDYMVPTCAELPTIVLEHLESLSPLNPLGLRGVGEGGAIAPPAAIANAVEDALSEFGCVVRGIPLSPSYVSSLLVAPEQALARRAARSALARAKGGIDA